MDYNCQKELQNFISNEQDISFSVFFKTYVKQISSEPFSSWQHLKSVWIKRYKDAVKESNVINSAGREDNLFPDNVFFQESFEEMQKLKKADEEKDGADVDDQRKTSSKSAKSCCKIIYFNEQSVSYLDIEWRVEEEEFGSKLMAYRKNAINNAAQGKKLSNRPLLMLNYIVLFDMPLSVVHELDMSHTTQAIKRQISRMQGYSTCSDDLSMLCYRLVQKALMEEEEEDNDEVDVESLVLEARLKAKKEKNTEKMLVLSLFETFYMKLKALSLKTEQSYIDSTLLPLFEQFFDIIDGTEHFSARGRLESLPSEPVLLLPLAVSSATTPTTPTTGTKTDSSSRKRAAPSSFCSWLSLQPDYLLKAVLTDIKFDLFAAEVKKPKAKITQLVDDEAKLGNLLKLMLDRLVINNIPSPVVCGLLDDDDSIKTYKMTIKSSGKYDLVQLACFRGIRSVDDLARLPGIVNHLTQLKNIICSMQQVIRITLLGEVLPGPLSFSEVPIEWLRPSFEYPALVTSNKKQK